MTEAQLDDFRSILESQRDEVQKNLKAHEATLNTPSDNRDFVGGDKAQELENNETNTALVKSEENLLQKIHHALERIEAGTYGTCEGCNGPIPLPRLEAKPSVSLCISCQEAHENG
ncbi:TraR/DksA family transcriptional regulator [Verrucomicrobiales bacterium BCK34]|nr:TraR/DksA family transcriptional regulator [Verrucomicrobiales bacterium BCK34]